jgi:tetratricopeptide (TPR) repeat protein
LARAAITDGRYWSFTGDRFTPLLEEALKGLGNEESALRAKVMIMHASHAQLELGRDGLLQRSEDAVALARRCGDVRATGQVLMWQFLIRQNIRALDPSIDCLGPARELLVAAQESRDLELVRAGRICCFWALSEAGELGDEAREHLAAHAAVTDALKIPADMHVTSACRASLATISGAFARAEELIHEAGHFEQRGVLAAYGTFIMQLSLLWLLQGRPDAALELLTSAEASRDSNGDLRLAIDHLRLWCLTQLGSREAIADALLVGWDPTKVPEDTPAARLRYEMGRTVAAPDAIALLNDQQLAARFYRRLLPSAGRTLSFGLYTNVASASRQLGVLATTLERYDDANQHFDAALAMNDRMGARPWLACTQLDYARMLQKRNASGDRERARELVEAALATAREIGMAKVAADCESLLPELGTARP